MSRIKGRKDSKVMIILYLQGNEKCPQGYLYFKYTDTPNLLVYRVTDYT